MDSLPTCCWGVSTSKGEWAHGMVGCAYMAGCLQGLAALTLSHAPASCALPDSCHLAAHLLELRQPNLAGKQDPAWPKFEMPPPSPGS